MGLAQLTLVGFVLLTAPHLGFCLNDVIRSTDPLAIEYLAHEDNPLHGEPGQGMRLRFNLRNKGDAGRFSVK